MKAQTAAVFFTHRFDHLLEQRYRHLKESSPREIPAFILAETGTPIPGGYVSETCFFDFRLLHTSASKTVGERIVPGSCHLAMLEFYKAHPGYGFYWFIEYDVVFTGRWEVLLGAFQFNDADLLACHVRSFEEEPDWHWWGTLETPGHRIPQREKLRVFMPVCRLSAAALDAISSRIREGWSGHHETVVPCALREASLKIEDIGGAGGFVPKGGKNRFYTSFSCPEGKLAALGTMRYLPKHAGVFGKSDFLYHPAKPERFGIEDFKFLLDNACRLLKSFPRRFLAHCFVSLKISLKSLIVRAGDRYFRSLKR